MIFYRFAFAGSEDIEMLLLNNNPISLVNSTAFSGLKYVKFLFLPAGVKNLQTDAFSGLEHVGKLKLAYLDLEEGLAPYTFRGMQNLTDLTIENSDLATIKTNAFSGNRKKNQLRVDRTLRQLRQDF